VQQNLVKSSISSPPSSKPSDNDLKVNKYISDVVEFGFKIPFLQEPPVVHFKTNLSAKNHADFVNCAMQELLDAGCIEEYTIKPHCINPLTVSINSSGKPRLIFDLRQGQIRR
jgi:hypothetical protein